MGNLWVTKHSVVGEVSDGSKVDIDAGVILVAAGLEIQSPLGPDLAAFEWIHGAHVIVSDEAIEAIECGWFALCRSEAIAMRFHPFILDGTPGYVPVCNKHTAESF